MFPKNATRVRPHQVRLCNAAPLALGPPPPLRGGIVIDGVGVRSDEKGALVPSTLLLHEYSLSSLLHVQLTDETGARQTLVWNTKAIPGKDSSTPTIPPGQKTLRYPVPKPVFVDKGTWPQGSTWARDPIPRIQDDRAGLTNASDCPGPNGRAHPHGCLAFEPPCPWDHGMLECAGAGCHGTGMGPCSADWVSRAARVYARRCLLVLNGARPCIARYHGVIPPVAHCRRMVAREVCRPALSG